MELPVVFLLPLCQIQQLDTSPHGKTSPLYSVDMSISHTSTHIHFSPISTPGIVAPSPN